MSLDVYLKVKGLKGKEKGSGIFVRKNGQVCEISRAEWDAQFPGHEPVVCNQQFEDDYVFGCDITHNLNKMADAAGIYEHLWRPDEIGVDLAAQLIDPLREGLNRLEADPEKFRAYNPANGWGNYEGLVKFVQAYLAACEKYPQAVVGVSR